jgi:oxygen-independent coproporphyrinogen-3 oxidase
MPQSKFRSPNLTQKPQNAAPVPHSIIADNVVSPISHGGLYLHWPFCETKCGYCDFYSVPVAGLNVDPVLDAVTRELHLRLSRPDFSIRTIFLGGGTPTTLDATPLATLIHAITRETAGQSVEEFTIEANPATVDANKAAILADSGVTRVSLGAQSFNAAELAILERIHCADDIPRAVATIRGGGIDNINLDLIFGVPGQTRESWRTSLKRAIELEPAHLACYGLTYEPGTSLTKRYRQGLVRPCDEDLEADLFLETIDTLEAFGYEQYEISNFARPDRQCRHNLIYWRNEPFIGVGPSAAGYIGDRRYKNVANHAEYVTRVERDGQAVADEETVTASMAAMEALMMQLRLREGLDVARVRARTGYDIADACAGAIERLSRQGLVACAEGRLRLTRQGMLVGDAVIAELAAAIDSRRGVSLPVVSAGKPK